MTIEKRRVGAYSGRAVYALLSDTGAPIADFPALEDAARVLRYLTGGGMSDEEQQRALAALRPAEQA